MVLRRYTATVRHYAYQEGAAEDRYGNPVAGYADPVERPVYAVAPKQTVEPDELGRRAVITGKTIYADWAPGPHDRVGYQGGLYEVQGEPGEWDNNPHTSVTRHHGFVWDIERSAG